MPLAPPGHDTISQQAKAKTEDEEWSELAEKMKQEMLARFPGEQLLRNYDHVLCCKWPIVAHQPHSWRLIALQTSTISRISRRATTLQTPSASSRSTEPSWRATLTPTVEVSVQ